MSTPSPLRCIRRMRPSRLTTVAGLLVALGCTDVEPPTAVPTPVGTANAIAVGTVAVATAIEDALDRVAPVLTDERAAKPLQMALENLIDALAGQGTTPAMAALERAEGTLNAYALAVGPDSGDVAELDVIALALAEVRAHFDTSSLITN